MKKWQLFLIAFFVLPICANAAQSTTDEFSKETHTTGEMHEEKTGLYNVSWGLNSFQNKTTKIIRDDIFYMEIYDAPWRRYSSAQTDEAADLEVVILRREVVGCYQSAPCALNEVVVIHLPPKFLERRYKGFKVRLVGNGVSKIITISQQQIEEIFSAQGRQPSSR